jgi:hypothetical protein
MIDEYEKKVVINELFNNNQEYINKFQEDIMNQRFMYIIIDSVSVIRIDADYSSFAEEELLWREFIELPLFEKYELVLESPETNVFILAPKTDALP